MTKKRSILDWKNLQMTIYLDVYVMIRYCSDGDKLFINNLRIGEYFLNIVSTFSFDSRIIPK